MTQPTSIRLPDKLKAKLKAWAKQESRPFSVHLVWILQKAIDWRDTQEKSK